MIPLNYLRSPFILLQKISPHSFKISPHTDIPSCHWWHSSRLLMIIPFTYLNIVHITVKYLSTLLMKSLQITSKVPSYQFKMHLSTLLQDIPPKNWTTPFRLLEDIPSSYWCDPSTLTVRYLSTLLMKSLRNYFKSPSKLLQDGSPSHWLRPWTILNTLHNTAQTVHRAIIFFKNVQSLSIMHLIGNLLIRVLLEPSGYLSNYSIITMLCADTK